MHLSRINPMLTTLISRARRVAVAAGLVSAMAAPEMASAQLTTFESLAYGPSVCQWGGGSSFSSLDGKTWNGLRPLDLDNLSNTCGRSTNTGYSQLLAQHVGNVIAVGAGGAWLSSFTPFTLNSFVAGAGWLNPTSLTVQYFLNAQLMSTQVLSLNTSQTGASLFTSNYAGPTDFVGFMPDYSNGVDVFNSYAESCAGAVGPCTPSSYKTWYIDNMSFSPAAVVVTPEPSSIIMMSLGLAGVAGVVRRRRAAR